MVNDAKALAKPVTFATDYESYGHEIVRGTWFHAEICGPASYICGYCNNKVGSKEGYIIIDGRGAKIAICPVCNCPTFFSQNDKQYPGSAYGNPVKGLPKNIETLYNETRYAASVGSYTGVIMLCRTILSHLAVENGAEEGLSFQKYVNYLDDKGFIPPKGKSWVDKIRNMGNDAVHEIKIMNKEDAEKIIFFTENLLRFNYELANSQ
jgi:hypothetical protein